MNESIYAVNQDNTAWREVDGEVIVINGATTYYYSMNKTSSYIWKLLLEGGAGIDYITQHLATQYQKQAKELRPHVEDFVRLLEEEALITSGSSSDGQGVPVSHTNASPAQDNSSTPYQEPRLVKYDTLEKLIVSGE